MLLALAGLQKGLKLWGGRIFSGSRLGDIGKLLSMSRQKQNRCLGTLNRGSGADAFDDEDGAAWGPRAEVA